MDKTKIEQGVSLILEGLEVDLTDHNFDETPQRVARAYTEIFASPERIATVFEEPYTDFILVKNHEMYTLCPHHLLPVRMRISLAYIPDGKVLGLSKLVRIMQQANSGPILQERFTSDVRSRLEHALETPGRKYSPNQKGVCVLVEGWHGCIAIRGVRSTASTITMASAGLFDKDPKTLERFLALTGRK